MQQSLAFLIFFQTCDINFNFPLCRWVTGPDVVGSWVVCQEMRSGDSRASDVARACMTLVSPHSDVDLVRPRDVTNGLMPPCPILLSESHSCLAVVWSVYRETLEWCWPLIGHRSLAALSLADNTRSSLSIGGRAAPYWVPDPGREVQHQPWHEGREEQADGVPDQHHHRPQQPRDDGLQGGHQRGLLWLIIRHKLLTQGVHLDPAQIIQWHGPPLTCKIRESVNSSVKFLYQENKTNIFLTDHAICFCQVTYDRHFDGNYSFFRSHKKSNKNEGRIHILPNFYF